MTTTTYSSNNSGGSWWLDDEDWRALEAAGWTVDWYKDRPEEYKWGEGDRFLGALATSASREGLPFRDAIQEWEDVTGEAASALGCSCCGTPHAFSSDDGDYYSPSFPAYGDDY